MIILVALILRGVAFEYRGKRDDAAWKRRWDYCIIGGSLVPALLWGVAFGNIVRGVRLDANHEYVGGFFDLLNPYALLGGLTTLILFTLHGAVFLALKTDGEVRRRAGSLAVTLGGPAIAVAGGFLLWTAIDHHDVAGWALSGGAAAALAGAVLAAQARREGWAFLATGTTIVLATFALFVTLFPDVMPSTIADANSLTTTNAASTAYTLRVMTWVAVAFTPIVLAYQGWTYWVFRRRLTVERIPVSNGTP
jgi:cytochrome d ubiquinol oxidase subunit II